MNSHADPYVDLPFPDLLARMRQDVSLRRPYRGTVSRIRPGTTAHSVLQTIREMGTASVADAVAAHPGTDPGRIRHAVCHLARMGIIVKVNGYPPYVWRVDLPIGDPTHNR